VLESGPLNDFPYSMEPQLRKLGLPTALQRGVINLTQDYTVCTKGSVLTPEQVQILVSSVKMRALTWGFCNKIKLFSETFFLVNFIDCSLNVV